MRWLVAILLVAGCTTSIEPQNPPRLPTGEIREAVAFIPTREKPVCVVQKIIDGDTVTIRCPNGEGNARLIGFDTPETFQSGCPAEKQLGQRAKETLTRVLANANVIEPLHKGRDKYNRILVDLTIDGRPLSRIMVEHGVAVEYDGGRRINWCKKLSA